MKPGDRIIVTGGPWPDRIGCHGVIATPRKHYPWHKLPKSEVVVLLDDDPLKHKCDDEDCPHKCRADNEWSMVIARKDITPYHS